MSGRRGIAGWYTDAFFYLLKNLNYHTLFVWLVYIWGQSHQPLLVLNPFLNSK
jgi:hypothetical protein